MPKTFLETRGPFSQKTTNDLLDASESVSNAMEERTVPDAVDFAWWSDDRLLDYFDSGEWYNLPVPNKVDLKTVLEMRGLIP